MTVEDEEPKHRKRVDNPDAQFIYVGDKQLKKLQKRAWDTGWWPEKKKSGIMWFAPEGGGHVMAHGSASDHRAYANLLSEFRKAGLDI